VWVACVLLALCFVRTIAESVLHACTCLEHALCTRCLYTVCGLDEKPALQLLRVSVILFCFFQPLLLCVIHAARHHLHQGNAAVQVAAFSNPCWAWNASATWGPFNATPPTRTVPVDMALSTVDVMIVLLPFCFVVSIDTMVWVGLTRSNFMTPEGPWDDTLEAENCYYDMSFLAVCFAFNGFMTFLWASGERPIAVLQFALITTLCEAYFVYSARMTESAIAEKMLCLTILALNGALSAASYLANLNSVALAALTFLSLHVMGVIGLHGSAMGLASSAQIVAMRLLLVCAAVVCVDCLVLFI
jgi:hypothetical protein